MGKMIYLAGAMDCHKTEDYDEATRWRKRIRKDLVHCNDNYYTNFKVFDPTLNEDDRHDVVSQNKYYLSQADILVVNLNNIDQSLGTIFEMVYANLNDIPIVTFGRHKWLNHPYLKHMSSINLNNERDITQFIKRAYGQ